MPAKPLPMMLRDDFNREEPLNENWREVYGGELTTMCGTLVSGNVLTFSGVSVYLSLCMCHYVRSLLIAVVYFNPFFCSKE